MTFGRFVLYATGAFSAGAFSYYFYQAGGNLHMTEIMIGKRLAELPFYYPPGPGTAEKNTALPQVNLPQDIVELTSAWFIHQDSILHDGVTRSDVLDFFGDKLGLVDNEKPDNPFAVGNEAFRKNVKKVVDDFIEKGRGRLMEYKRQSGVSIQETLTFFDTLIGMHQEIDSQVVDRINHVLGEELERLMGEQNLKAKLVGDSTMTEGSPLIEVEASEKELIEMEIAQLENSKSSILKRSSQLSDAETERLQRIETQIKELKTTRVV
jgi:hypothetical protein